MKKNTNKKQKRTTKKQEDKEPRLAVHPGLMYKVLVDDKPCHGGSGAYPPIGEWTTPVKPVCCSAGYHLTSDPIRWWKPNAKLFVAEAAGAVSSDGRDEKAAFESVRLVYEVTPEWPLIGAHARVRAFIAAVQRTANTEANISWANLSGANLSRANLSGANLSGANLSGANLSWADLSGANLSWANLSWADLSGANLSWADLSGANLSGANLSGANLSRANLSGANLSGANLSGANLSWAVRPAEPPSGWKIVNNLLEREEATP